MKNRDLEFAKQLLQVASVEVQKALSAPYEIMWKKDNTPVTDIDIMVSTLVIDAIRKNYPHDAIYGEEEGRKEGQSGYTWILDPIDGTQALGMLQTSTICLARTNKNGSPVFSVVVNPNTNEIFYSKRNESYVNNQKMKVSTKDTLKGSYIYLGSRMQSSFASNGSIYDALEGRGAKVFNVRSLAYSCLMVATGKAEGAYIGVSTPFEAASIKLLVENAGGKITDLDGKEIERFDAKINGLIASNAVDEIHDTLVSFARLKST